ncbi:MAG TPA: hypothetical protein VNN07_13730 [Candidatus Tectomicrobia bacterium]|nr:hypothetical protein [Candidatus Tectomicrobia bacterium]
MTVRALLIGGLMLATTVTAVTAAPVAKVDADVVLYEVTENMQFTVNGAVVTRDAIASLQGTAKAGTPLCPTALLQFLLSQGWQVSTTECFITAVGQDSIDVATGAGAVSGTFAVVATFTGDNPVDAPEFVVQTGSFAGQMQQRGPLPIIDMTGTMTITAGPAVPFVGVFRLPFSNEPDGTFGPVVRGRDAFYLSDDLKRIVVKPTEYSLGFPTVRVEIQFTAP